MVYPKELRSVVLFIAKIQFLGLSSLIYRSAVDPRSSCGDLSASLLPSGGSSAGNPMEPTQYMDIGTRMMLPSTPNDVSVRSSSSNHLVLPCTISLLEPPPPGAGARGPVSTLSAGPKGRADARSPALTWLCDILHLF